MMCASVSSRIAFMLTAARAARVRGSRTTVLLAVCLHREIVTNGRVDARGLLEAWWDHGRNSLLRSSVVGKGCFSVTRNHGNTVGGHPRKYTIAHFAIWSTDSPASC